MDDRHDGLFALHNIATKAWTNVGSSTPIHDPESGQTIFHDKIELP